MIDRKVVSNTTLKGIPKRNIASEVGNKQYRWFLSKDGLYELLFLGKNDKCKKFMRAGVVTDSIKRNSSQSNWC